MTNELEEVSIQIASKDPALEDLAMQVLEAGVDAASADARQFVMSVLHREIIINDQKAPARCLQGLPVESRLALYQVIASEDHENRERMLAALNRSFSASKNFDDAYEAMAKEHADGFFGDPEKIEALWRKTGQRVCSFSEVMHRFITEPGDVSNREKRDICKFLVPEYAAHNGLNGHEAKFFRAGKSTGAAIRRYRSGVGINTRGEEFTQNPLSLPGIIAHEIEHHYQTGMAFAFALDKIPPTSQFFNVAWAMRANLFSPFGYLETKITSNKGARFYSLENYMNQPSERGAKVTEEYVTKLVLKNWRRNPSAG